MTLAGQQLGHYRVIRQIGQGGMGEVYLAEDSHVTRQVAIKVVRNEQAPYPDNNTIEEVARLFQREMKSISQLDHSHILNIYDFGEEMVTGGSIIYMVMPYRSEGSLTDWLARRGSGDLLSPQDVGGLLMQAAAALQHVHDRNIIHQDVKPSNFLIRSNPEHPSYPDLFLVDFGVARVTTATSVASNSVRGTFTYMAPEQWNAAAVPATDQYALAIMAYQLLTGKPPFQGRPEQVMFQHLNTPPRPPGEVNPRLSPALDAVLLRALAKNPTERFPSIGAFAAAFRQALTYNTRTATLLLKPDAQALPDTYASVEPTLAAAFQPVLPPLPVSTSGKPAVSPLRYIVGTLLVVGILSVGIFSFNVLSSRYTITSRTNNSTATISTHSLTPKVSLISKATHQSVSTTTNTPTATGPSAPTAIPYPSYSDAKAAITYYYENESDFQGKNVIQNFDSLTYNQQTGPADQPQFLACAQYTFALVSSPNITVDTARHTFTFQYGNGAWSVIDMGNWQSC